MSVQKSATQGEKRGQKESTVQSFLMWWMDFKNMYLMQHMCLFIKGTPFLMLAESWCWFYHIKLKHSCTHTCTWMCIHPVRMSHDRTVKVSLLQPEQCVAISQTHSLFKQLLVWLICIFLPLVIFCQLQKRSNRKFFGNEAEFSWLLPEPHHLSLDRNQRAPVSDRSLTFV